jgi:PAS domain S-box-containing protein
LRKTFTYLAFLFPFLFIVIYLTCGIFESSESEVVKNIGESYKHVYGKYGTEYTPFVKEFLVLKNDAFKERIAFSNSESYLKVIYDTSPVEVLSAGLADEFVFKSWFKLFLVIILIAIALFIRYLIQIYKNRIKVREGFKELKRKENLEARIVEKGKEQDELFNNNPIPMWVYDLDTLKFLFVNHAAVHHYGYTKEEFLSMTLKDIRPPEEIPKLEDNLSKPEKDIEKSSTWLHKKKDGTFIYVEIVSHCLPLKYGVRSRLVMALDVTEKVRLNNELINRGLQYRQLVEQAMVGILVVDSNTKIVFANAKICEMLNYTYEELTSLTIVDTYIKEEFQLILNRLDEVQLKGKVNYERKVRRKDGSFFYAEVSSAKLDDGRSLGLIKDITDRKIAEEELYKSKKQYQAFFEDDLTGIFISTPSGHMKTCNRSLLRILGFDSFDEIKDYDLNKLYPTRKDRNNLLRKLTEHKKVENIEVEMLNRRGERIYVIETIQGTFNSEDELIEIKGYMIDITKKKMAEIQFRKISQIVEQSPLSIIITDIGGKVEYANTKFLETNNCLLKEITGLDYISLERGLQETENSKTFISILKSDADWKGELQFINENGKLSWERISTFAINLTGDTTHRAIIKENITDNKYSEESLIHSESQLRSVWENTSDAMRLLNDHGIMIKVNNAFCKLFNKSRQELEGFPFYIIYKDPNENIISDFRKYFRNRTAIGILESESILWDSRKIWVENANSFIEIENQQPILLSIFRNVTVRKEAEAQLITAKEKAEELNSLKSNLLENMSHELRTPMIGILGFSQMLSVNLTNPEYREMANTIYLSGKRLLRTMDMVIDLSRVESNNLDLELREINICDAVSNELKIFEKEAENKKLFIKKLIREEKIIALLDERLFLQVFDNLMSNAIKFTKKGGVSVEVLTEQQGSGCIPVIQVTDTGIGIEKESLELIFHEFRQESEGFKRKFEGAGLGLSISKKFVEIMNGTISVESIPGEGSVFTLKFYNQSGKAKLKDINAAVINPKGELTNWHKNKILLVDDDENMWEIVKLILKKICVVDIAVNAERALQLVNKNSYDIILMDIVLGFGMNGIELTKEIRKIKGNESLPIIAVTAYAMPEDKTRFIEEGFTDYVSKPFDLNQFRRFIIEMLEPAK